MQIAIDFAALVLDAAAMLLYLLGWAVALGLLYTWNATFHQIFKFIADALTFTIKLPLVGSRTVHLGGWATDIDTLARNALSDWAVGCEIIVGKLWYVFGWTVYETVSEIQSLAKDTLALGHWIVHTAVPTYVDGVTHLLHATTKVIHTTTTVVETKVTHLTKTVAAVSNHAVTVLDREVAGLRERLWHDERVLEHVATHGIDELPARLGTRLRKVEGLFGATVMAAVMANVLGVSARCLRKGNIGRVSRALCGLSAEAFNDLLGLLVDVLIVEDVCQVIVLLEDALSLVQGPLNAFVDVVDGALCHGDYDAPPTIETPALHLPPVAGLSLSLV